MKADGAALAYYLRECPPILKAHLPGGRGNERQDSEDDGSIDACRSKDLKLLLIGLHQPRKQKQSQKSGCLHAEDYPEEHRFSFSRRLLLRGHVVQSPYREDHKAREKGRDYYRIPRPRRSRMGLSEKIHEKDYGDREYSRVFRSCRKEILSTSFLYFDAAVKVCPVHEVRD